MVRNWNRRRNRRSPNNFRFTTKFPKIVTHDKSFKKVEPLKDKLLSLLIQSLAIL